MNPDRIAQEDAEVLEQAIRIRIAAVDLSFKMEEYFEGPSSIGHVITRARKIEEYISNG